VFEVFSPIGAGDTVAVGLGVNVTIALLFARFVGSATHAVTSRQAAIRRTDPKYCFIPGTLPVVGYAALLGNVCAARPQLVSLLMFLSAPLRETSRPLLVFER